MAMERQNESINRQFGIFSLSDVSRFASQPVFNVFIHWDFGSTRISCLRNPNDPSASPAAEATATQRNHFCILRLPAVSGDPPMPGIPLHTSPGE